MFTFKSELFKNHSVFSCLPLRSKWCAPSGINIAMTLLLTFFKMPPDDHGSKSPLLKGKTERNWRFVYKKKNFQAIFKTNNCFYWVLSRKKSVLVYWRKSIMTDTIFISKNNTSQFKVKFPNITNFLEKFFPRENWIIFKNMP